MRGDRSAIFLLVVVAGLTLEAAKAPIVTWLFRTVSGWFVIVPDLEPNLAKLAGELAWPLVGLIFLLIFRQDLSRIIGSVKRFTWGDKVIDLSSELDRIEETVEQVDPLAQVEGLELPDDRFQRLLEISPAAAILDAWASIDERITSLAAQLGYSDPVRASVRRLIDFLKKEGQINEPGYALLLDLSKIRNRAAHLHDISTVDAIRFYDLAQSAKRYLPAGF
ncbi:hypothetical protein [Qipengyuania aquimaris]|uniref:hypothetical protein n=1 Tax=Qipengyuania aquimaris TaxID=255984 RepID=UPI001CD22549|nr:hypothetical protein [Qipengyuania aquimaris]MCA0904670.1 hypothetical protein [Qipengyuania aquimaris]